MNTANLSIYLKDHFAGSVAAVELLDHLISAFGDRPEADVMRLIKAEVEDDQDLLRQALDRIEAEESTLKKAGAWIAEKFAIGKMKIGDDNLGLLEALEMLVLGIEGKLRLWRSIELLDLGLDITKLKATAAAQIEKVEALRMQAALRSFEPRRLTSPPAEVAADPAASADPPP